MKKPDIDKAVDKPMTRGSEKRGPKADTLKIKGSWQAAIKQTLEKKKPTTGWSK